MIRQTGMPDCSPVQPALARCLVPLDPSDWRDKSQARLASLARLLAEPIARVTPEKLAGMFMIDQVIVTARRPPNLQSFPELATRIRGALGNVLAAMGPPVYARKDYGARPRAFDVLWRALGQSESGDEIAKPLVIKADVRSDTVTVTASLFGLAGFWKPDVAAALVGALEDGIKLNDSGPVKVALPCLDLVHRRIAGFEPPSFAVREARLIFRTPLRLRAGRAEASSPAALPIALLNRAVRIAPWQQMAIEMDWPAMHRAARRIGVSGELVPYRWERGSQRMRKRIPVLGNLGAIVLRGDLDPFWPFLRIAENAHVGSHAALGLGQFDLSLLP